MDSAPAPPRVERSLWPLALLAGLLPAAATAIAYLLSIQLGLVPACNPFVDGCVSISRAARHDLPNLLFRALLLPAAALQAICWLLCPGWLRTLGAPPDRGQRALPWLGLAAAVCLVTYGSFLGTDGEGYRWLRRHAVPLYFGLTCIGMLVVSEQMQRRLKAGPQARRVARALWAVCLLLPLLGLAYVFVPLAWHAARDTIENVTEWWGGAIFTAFFVVLAWAWRSTEFSVELRSGGG